MGTLDLPLSVYCSTELEELGQGSFHVCARRANRELGLRYGGAQFCSPPFVVICGYVE
jgi:hypothetical protein